MNANLTKTDDLKYKGGFVKCSCGWTKQLGDGFNGYHIDKCPACCPDIETRSQRKVTVGRPKNYTVTLGNHIYFTINNCIQVQFEAKVYSTHTGLSIRKADAL